MGKRITSSWLPFPCFFCRETTDSYTLAASPGFALLGRTSSMLSARSRSSLDIDGNKAPLLPDHGSKYQVEDYDKLSKVSSRVSALGSLHEHLGGELPIGQGCSFTQTVFNGEHIFMKLTSRICNVMSLEIHKSLSIVKYTAVSLS